MDVTAAIGGRRSQDDQRCKRFREDNGSHRRTQACEGEAQVRQENQAGRLEQDHWSKISALATALIERTTMTSDECREILSRSLQTQ